MDTVQIMILYSGTDLAMREQYYVQLHADFFYFSYELFLCIIIFNSVMEHFTVLLILSLSLY